MKGRGNKGGKLYDVIKTKKNVFTHYIVSPHCIFSNSETKAMTKTIAMAIAKTSANTHPRA